MAYNTPSAFYDSRLIYVEGIAAMKMYLVIALLFCAVSSANAQEIASVDEGFVRPCAALPCERTAVVFIHGLGGTFDTWKNDDTNTYWPKLLAEDPDIAEKIDVYVVRYDSYLLGTSPSITLVAKAIAKQLDGILIDKHDYQRVIFIAHSLGGIVAVDYLSHLKTLLGHRNLARARLLMTFGSPLTGGNGARLGAAFSFNPQVRILVDIDRNDYMQLVTNRWDEILQKRATNQCGAFRIYSAFETVGITGVGGIVVEENSATAFVHPPNDVKKGFPVNHFDLVKPKSRDDEIYTWTKAALKKCTDKTDFCAAEISATCH
jgi:pimeloyl-ACP methyl ester carboxylesterase